MNIEQAIDDVKHMYARLQNGDQYLYDLPAIVNELDQLRKELAEVKAVVGIVWLPISTAPKDGTWVALYAPDASSEKVQAGYWGPSYFDYDPMWIQYSHRADFEAVDGTPTHWMPLPPPPQAALAAKEASHDKR